MIPRQVFEETLLQFFAPVRAFLEDPTVSDVMINGPDQVYVERRGRLELTNARFESREALAAALRNEAHFSLTLPLESGGDPLAALQSSTPTS